ncbi:hypothetical protein DY000_02048078 [Brassica cretica]|uniref:Uncharacterized protein n=1 Tax=Brassica cretica TaxID=69181 RepID=A0ABQ7F720_BRACR|nr:hypothetical protein DY000_02048078 [Brassica cretica]
MTENMKWVGYGLQEIASKGRRECVDLCRIDVSEELDRYVATRQCACSLVFDPTGTQTRGLDINFVVTVFNPNKQYNGIDRQQHGNTDRQQPKRSDQQPPMPYRVRLLDLDAHRLKETRNPSQTSVCLKTTEKISQQSVEAPEQEQSTLAETSFVLPGVDRRHLPGFHKKVKRVPKDMSFEDAYHKYILGNFFRESRETDKDIELLFNKGSRKPKSILKKEQDPGKFMIPCSIHSHHLPNALCDTGSASSESIDTKPSASVDTLQLSKQPETEKSKSGGRTKNRKKKKKSNVDADFLPLVPLQSQEGSLEYRVRCRGELHRCVRCLSMDGDLLTVKLSPSFDRRYIFEFAFQLRQFEVNQHPVSEVMPVLLKSGQPASREEAVEEMKDCRSTVMP